ncbi:MAG: hypothetical protein HFE30_01445 [Clostridiales bacterium]|nr:hypothetical protein [Clostridiales bacterium]
MQPSFLLDLVDREAANSWYNDVVVPNIENNTEPQEMYTVSFVKHFKISKEEFEQANEQRKLLFEKFRVVNGDDISDEGHEIYNADIIYTFDNNIINNYYRRDICTYSNPDDIYPSYTNQNISSDTETDEWIK